MKHWPPRPPRAAPAPRRRIPAFHPVSIGPRHDGWTLERQAAFIGKLAETRSVLAAARAMRMGRESAYRLRKRPGAAGFAAAWDAALGRERETVHLSVAKSTDLPAAYRAGAGLVQVVMHAGRYATFTVKPDTSALLQHLAQLDRACRGIDAGERRSHSLAGDYLSTPTVSRV